MMLGIHLVSSLNPALEDVRFCPRCGKDADVAFPHLITCRHCGYGAYYNPKPVAAAIPRTPDGKVVLLKRGFEPGKGFWTFPGGFVDLGESVEEAATRELMEEIAVEAELQELVGIYSKPDDRVILIVYAATINDTPQTTAEAPEVRAFEHDELPWDELAFWSTHQALNDYLARHGRS